MKKYEMPAVLPDKINREDWADFIDSRIDIGHPLTPTAAKRTIKKLLPYSAQIIHQALSTAMERGYRGVFPESEKEIERSFVDEITDRSWRDGLGEDSEIAPTNLTLVG